MTAAPKPITKIEGLTQIHDKIKGIPYAMLTTMGEDGLLRSRPLYVTEGEIDGNLWFFTEENTEKTFEIAHLPEVNLAYADVKENTFVSISGKASIVKDRVKMEQLWKPLLRPWFPKALDEPNIALLKIEIQEAEFWDSSSSKMTQLINMAKAIITGNKTAEGDHKEIKLV